MPQEDKIGPPRLRKWYWAFAIYAVLLGGSFWLAWQKDLIWLLVPATFSGLLCIAGALLSRLLEESRYNQRLDERSHASQVRALEDQVNTAQSERDSARTELEEAAEAMQGLTDSIPSLNGYRSSQDDEDSEPAADVEIVEYLVSEVLLPRLPAHLRKLPCAPIELLRAIDELSRIMSCDWQDEYGDQIELRNVGIVTGSEVIISGDELSSFLTHHFRMPEDKAHRIYEWILLAAEEVPNLFMTGVVMPHERCVLVQLYGDDVDSVVSSWEGRWMATEPV